MTAFVIHYSQRSRWEGSATLHRAGCGKVPFTGRPGRKRQGVEVDLDHALGHANAEGASGYYKVCSCAWKALRNLEVTS